MLIQIRQKLVQNAKNEVILNIRIKKQYLNFLLIIF